MSSENPQLCTYCKQHVPNEYDWNFAVEGSKHCWEHRPWWETLPKKVRVLLVVLPALVLLFQLLGLFLPWSVLTAALSPPEEVIQTLASTPTPTLVSVEVAAINEVTEEVVVQEGVVYLRVETQRLDTAYGIWRREPGIPVFLSPFVERDAAPNAQRENTFRQVTEKLLTADSVLVAVTTFEAQPGMYWVWVDGLDLPAGCSVWVPRFVGDADSDIIVGEPVVIRLDAYEGFNTFVLKFQIVCGQVALGPTPTVVRTSPPQETPTDPPDTPVPTSTSPPPVPTICVSCLPPLTPVATPTSYSPSISTPTSVFDG